MSKPTTKPPNPGQQGPEPLETIDLAKLATVAGGKSREPKGGGESDAVMAALTGILDSINSLAKQNSGGMSAADFMLAFMMMSQGRGSAVATPHQPATSWTWDATNGYWIVK